MSEQARDKNKSELRTSIQVRRQIAEFLETAVCGGRKGIKDQKTEEETTDDILDSKKKDG